MRRTLLALLSLCFVAWLMLANVRSAAPSTVYTVAQVVAGLHHNPQAWVGRTVLVQAIAYDCPRVGACPFAQRSLFQPGVPGTWLPLTMVTNPALGFLRRVPLVDRVVPGAVRWRAPEIYRIQLQTTLPPACAGANPCYAALLLDG